jgi:[protein-PII] uridylyltransferase
MFSVPGASGLALARHHAQFMDKLLITVHDAALAATSPRRRPAAFAMAAVGGYGRGLLGWKSDLDLRFIASRAPDKLRPITDAIVDSLRDAGISIAYQVMTASDALAAAGRELPAATALLDLRVLAGESALADELRERAYGSLFSDAQLPRFLEQLEAEVAARHRRLGGSVYMLEPDVKSGMGGTRDLDIAVWAALARWKTSDPDVLSGLGVLSARDVADMRAAAEFMWTLRNRIHLRMGRRCDQLTFSEQDSIAPALDYATRLVETAGAARQALLSASVEAFMSDYYRHARNVVRLSDQIVWGAKLRQPAPAQRELGGGLSDCAGSIGLTEPEQLATDPTLALRLYVAAVERSMPVLASSRAAIVRLAGSADWASALRESREASALFVQLASDPRRAPFRNGSILSELHDVGLLVAMIPEFAPLVGRAHRELSHVYTMDVHSLAALDRLRALQRGEFAAQHPLASRLAAQLTRPEVLCLAVLLHAIGKASASPGHVKRGADMAGVVLERLGFSSADNATACQLIRNQLKMYLAAVRRDVEDPATLAEFAGEGQNPDSLRDLYLLTVVNVSTISPSSMTKWKASMLNALFLASDAQLRGAATTGAGQVSRVRAQLKAQWASESDAAFLDDFLDSMPERYLSRNSAAEIVAHARVAERLTDHPVCAALVPSRHPDVSELCVVTETSADPGLCVVTDDQPGLLASITAAISAAGLEIHSAQIHSRSLPDDSMQAVDLFWVRSPEGPQGVSAALPKLEQDLEQVITGRITAGELLKRGSLEPGPRALPRKATEVVFNHHASAKYTVIEVLTDDRPGLLFSIAQAFHRLGVSIALAKISTEGDRASDVFYVTEFDGAKFDSEARARVVHERLLEVLDGSRAA